MEAETRNHILFISAQTVVIVSWLEGRRKRQEEKRASVKRHKWDIFLLCPIPSTHPGTSWDSASQTVWDEKNEGEKGRKTEKERERLSLVLSLSALGKGTHTETSSLWAKALWFPLTPPYDSRGDRCNLDHCLGSSRDSSKSAQILIEEIKRILALGDLRSQKAVALSLLLMWHIWMLIHIINVI